MNPFLPLQPRLPPSDPSLFLSLLPHIRKSWRRTEDGDKYTEPRNYHIDHGHCLYLYVHDVLGEEKELGSTVQRTLVVRDAIHENAVSRHSPLLSPFLCQTLSIRSSTNLTISSDTLLAPCPSSLDLLSNIGIPEARIERSYDLFYCLSDLLCSPLTYFSFPRPLSSASILLAFLASIFASPALSTDFLGTRSSQRPATHPLDYRRC